jgi:hypothetical protein
MSLCNTSNDMLERERDFYKEKLKYYYNEKCKGYQIRSKVQWIEEGEKSTSFFLNLEKQRQNNNVIKRLHCTNGSLIDTDSGILKESVKFHTNLFKSTKPLSENHQMMNKNCVKIMSMKMNVLWLFQE